MCLIRVIQHWLDGGGTSEYPVTWDGFYSLLMDAECAEIAKELRNAVCLAVPPPAPPPPVANDFTPTYAAEEAVSENIMPTSLSPSHTNGADLASVAITSYSSEVCTEDFSVTSSTPVPTSSHESVPAPTPVTSNENTLTGTTDETPNSLLTQLNSSSLQDKDEELASDALSAQPSSDHSVQDEDNKVADEVTSSSLKLAPSSLTDSDKDEETPVITGSSPAQSSLDDSHTVENEEAPLITHSLPATFSHTEFLSDNPHEPESFEDNAGTTSAVSAVFRTQLRREELKVILCYTLTLVNPSHKKYLLLRLKYYLLLKYSRTHTRPHPQHLTSSLSIENTLSHDFSQYLPVNNYYTSTLLSLFVRLIVRFHLK